MKTKKMPLPKRSGTAIVNLAVAIEATRKSDPARYLRIMRKLAELECRAEN